MVYLTIHIYRIYLYAKKSILLFWVFIGWWFKPDYIINNLNINSAVARPWHDEVLPIGQNEPYTIKGYAYAGQGHKIIRVEISLDDGTTWRLAEIRRFEKPNAYGGAIFFKQYH